MRARAQRGCSSYNDLVPREGMLKPRQMLQTWNLKGVDISKTKSCGFGSGKNEWRLNWHLILLQLMSEELCKQPWDSWIPVWSLQRRSMTVWRAREREKRATGQRGEAMKSLLHWQSPGVLLLMLESACFVREALLFCHLHRDVEAPRRLYLCSYCGFWW